MRRSKKKRGNHQARQSNRDHKNPTAHEQIEKIDPDLPSPAGLSNPPKIHRLSVPALMSRFQGVDSLTSVPLGGIVTVLRPCEMIFGKAPRMQLAFQRQRSRSEPRLAMPKHGKLDANVIS